MQCPLPTENGLRLPNNFVISNAVAMGMRATYGEKNASVQQPPFIEPSLFPLSSRAKPRDLQFRGPFVEMFFDQSVAICCFSYAENNAATS